MNITKIVDNILNGDNIHKIVEDSYEEADEPIYYVYQDEYQSADDAEMFWDKDEAIDYAKKNHCVAVDGYTDTEGFYRVWG